MATSSKRIGEGILLVTTAMAGALLFHAVASAAFIEPPGCANQTCKMIRYFFNCSLQSGTVQKEATCLVCVAQDGRCNNGNNNACNDSGVTRHWNRTNVTNVCDCAKTPNGSGYVEATGNYTGDYLNSTVDVFTGC
jgi:hypothetical protein